MENIIILVLLGLILGGAVGQEGAGGVDIYVVEQVLIHGVIPPKNVICYASCWESRV